tara:strand:+ start:1300 stop:1941 length:642 start_codon:yes stop_codon:yes gene_type:complete
MEYTTIVKPDGTIEIVPVEQTNNLPFDVGGRLFDQFNTAPGILNVPPRSFQSVFPTNVQTGIMTQAPIDFKRFEGITKETDIDDDTQDEVEETKTGGGIANLFRAILGFAVPGANLFLGGLEGIKSLNQRLRATDFGQSTSFADYLQRRRDRKAREEAAMRGADKQRIENLRKFNEGAGQYFSGRDDGIGSAGGGAPSPGSAGPGGSDEMGSF